MAKINLFSLIICLISCILEIDGYSRSLSLFVRCRYDKRPPSFQNLQLSPKINEANNDRSKQPLEKLLDELSSEDESSDNDQPDLLNAIEQRVREEQPPDWQVRMDIMGFTPLTIAGFALAAAILTCNAVLGTGWASRLLGWDDSWSVESPSPVTLRGQGPAVQPTEEQLRILEKIKQNYYSD